MTNLDHAWKLHQAGQWDAARAIYLQATTNPATVTNAFCFLGILHYDLGQYEESLAYYERTLEIRPDFPVALSNRANTLAALGRMDEAIQSCEQALSLKPDYGSAWTNLGAVHTKLGHFDQAAECFRKSLEVAPQGNETAHRNLGAALVSQGELQAAEEHTAQALEISPRSAEAHRNRAIIMLLRGEFEEGWEEYEWRWHCGDVPQPTFDQPRYDGQPLAGKRLLLHAEQGLGDTIQFIRYAELAQQRGAHVIVQCQKPLTAVLQSYPYVDHLLPVGVELPPHDFQLPLMSAPRVFGTRLDSIPAETPYLSPAPALLRKWARRLDAVSGLRVGIVWRGSADHRADRQRSFALAELAPLAGEHVTFIPLQMGAGRSELKVPPAGMNLFDPGDELDRDCGAFMDTAALICLMDVVICCDTSVAHLSAALHTPTWIALSISPDWRWLLGRDDSPWYPTVRLFRQQQANQWSDVFDEIGKTLRQLAPRRKPNADSLFVEVGAGELLDKLSILEIKLTKISDAEKLANVQTEFETLDAIRRQQLPWSEPLRERYQQLKSVNAKLWQIEDEIRCCETAEDFGDRFVRLARSVYQENDRRAAIKREINQLIGSRIVEEKSYPSQSRRHRPRAGESDD